MISPYLFVNGGEKSLFVVELLGVTESESSIALALPSKALFWRAKMDVSKSRCAAIYLEDLFANCRKSGSFSKTYKAGNCRHLPLKALFP